MDQVVPFGTGNQVRLLQLRCYEQQSRELRADRSQHHVAEDESHFGPWDKTEYFVNAGYGFHSNDARGVFTTIDPKTNLAVDPVTLVRTKGAELGVRTEIIPKVQSSLAL